MKTVIVSILLSLLPIFGNTQVIWSETFNDLNQDDQVDNGASAWSTSCPSCPPTTGGLPEDFHVDGPAGNRYFKWNGTNANGTWLSETVDISTWEDISISLLTRSRNNNTGIDQITVQYSLDEGAWTNFTTNGFQSGNFGTTNPSVGPLNGTLIQIRVIATSSATNRYIYIDNIVISGIDVLPVQLIDFSAVEKNKQIEVDWHVASEENVAAYEIQLSQNGFDFNTVKTINGKGNTSIGNKYNCLVDDYSNLTEYVRLVEIGTDGRKHIVTTASIDIESTKHLNFAGNKVLMKNVDLNSTLSIYTIGGQLHKSYNLIEEETFELQDLTNGASGLFIAVYQNNDTIESKKFSTQ